MRKAAACAPAFDLPTRAPRTGQRPPPPLPPSPLCSANARRLVPAPGTVPAVCARRGGQLQCGGRLWLRGRRHRGLALPHWQLLPWRQPRARDCLLPCRRLPHDGAQRAAAVLLECEHACWEHFGRGCARGRAGHSGALPGAHRRCRRPCHPECAHWRLCRASRAARHPVWASKYPCGLWRPWLFRGHWRCCSFH